MRLTRRAMLSGIAAAAVATTAACSTPKKKEDTTAPAASASGSGSKVTASGSLTVLWNQFFYSQNPNTAFGNNVTNANINYVTNSGYWYYNKDLQKVKDETFGTYEKTSDDPITVKQTIADTAMWSDGVPVTAHDLIMNYGAQSTLFNTMKEADIAKLQNQDTGEMKENPDGQVYFDASSVPWSYITDFPEVAADGKSITYKYGKPYADWEYALIGTGLPAHVMAKIALGESDPTKGKEAVVKAFKDKDAAALSKLSSAWNTRFNFTSMPSDASLVVANGPYTITGMQDKKSLTLTANEKYKGGLAPKIKTVTVIYNEDPTASALALKNGEVSIIEPQATSDLLKSLQGNANITVMTGDQASYEHVDLTFDNGGPFDPKSYGGDAEKAKKVRKAFLMCIPRQQIVDNLIKPLNPNAVVRQSYNQTPGSTNYDATVQANGMATTFAKVDTEGAKKLLAEAGATNVKVRLLYAKLNKRRIQEFQLIKESAAKAGITVVDNGNEKWSNKLGDNTYDAAMFAWSSSNDSLAGGASNYITKGQNNFGHYSNKQVDDWYAELNKETDDAKKTELNSKIEKQLVDDAFSLTIFQFPDVTAFDNKKVKNVSSLTFNPNYFWNIWQWELVG